MTSLKDLRTLAEQFANMKLVVVEYDKFLDLLNALEKAEAQLEGTKEVLKKCEDYIVTVEAKLEIAKKALEDFAGEDFQHKCNGHDYATCCETELNYILDAAQKALAALGE